MKTPREIGMTRTMNIPGIEKVYNTAMLGDTFVIRGLAGGKSLSGTIAVSGAKNAALPVMAASAMVSGETRLENVPDIRDIDSMARLLEKLGAFVTRKDHTLSVGAKNITGSVLDTELSKSMRASILLSGPLLARFGRVTFPHPGGCVLGSRPIDVFIDGFKKLDAEFSEDGETYTLSAPHGLSGGDIFFRTVSVTGTETLMMAATAARSPVTLRNAAMEPEVVATAEFLKACGAVISGAGTPTIVIFPSSLQPPASSFQIIPDRIEAASFLVLGALAGEGITVSGTRPEHLGAVIEALLSMGVPLSIEGDSITVSAPEKLSPIDLKTHEYPGFPTDVQAPLTVLLTQASGESTVLETIFDGRLNYVSELVRMGADIQLWNPHKASVRGTTSLKARDINGPDIRAGLAFILAAVAADDVSHIGNARLIDRGYENIENKLSAVGVSIKRE